MTHKEVLIFTINFGENEDKRPGHGARMESKILGEIPEGNVQKQELYFGCNFWNYTTYTLA